MALEFGFKLDDRIFETLAGIRPDDSLRRFVDADVLNKAVSRLEDLEVEFADETTPLPGARQLLTTLPLDKWAVATSAGRRLATARWVGAGIPLPPVVVAGGHVEQGKPHPDPYLKAASRLGAAPADCVVFEDSAAGGRSAVEAGSVVVAVGSQSWPLAPSCRVPSLEHVHVRTLDSGQLVFELSSTLAD